MSENANSSNLNSSIAQETEAKQQEAILLELKMILDTVKSIDKNLIKSIKLLREPTSTGLRDINGNTTQVELNHDDLIRRNIETISDILGMLDSL